MQNEGQPGLQVDVPHEGDQVIAAEERPVLSIDAHLASALEGATLDTVETAEGTRLTIVGVGSGDSDAPSRDGTY